MPWFSFALLSTLFASLYALVQKHAMNCQIGVFRWLTQTFIVTFMAFAFYTFVVHRCLRDFLGFPDSLDKNRRDFGCYSGSFPFDI